MNRRLVLGVLLAVVASAVTASVVVVIGQDRGEPEIGPSKALRPSEITKIPAGTPAVGLTDPIDYGPFRILPAGTPPPRPCGVPVPPGLAQERVDVRESPTLDEFRNHELFFEPPYLPAGWELTEAHAETVVWDDGSQTDSRFALYFTRADYFPITITRALRPGDCRIERVEWLPEGQHAYTLGEIRGVPVLYLHQAPGELIQADMSVALVMDGVLTAVESVAIDFDELIKIAEALIVEFEEPSP